MASPSKANTGMIKLSQILESIKDKRQNTPVITKWADLPQGELISAPGGMIPMTDEWRQHIAVLKNEDGVHLIVDSQYYGRPQMFELIRRINSIVGGDKVNVLHVAHGLIEVAYLQEKERETRDSVQHDLSDVEQFVAEMIEQAAAMKSSDIHIEARSTKANVFFRVNGRRILWREIGFFLAYSVGQVLYVHADAGSKEVSWNPEAVMDGAINWKLQNGSQYQLRFSSSPIHPSGGFHIVIRMLCMDVKGVKLAELGYSDAQMRLFDIMTSGASGILLLCGPTNSGKSTTMQALMQNIYARRGDTIKMITVEDPVEYIIPGACQIPVARNKKMVIDERSGSAFTTFLRGTLRQDPDVVMVGEIRDFDSASVVKDLVLAGRKIIATLHTYSALWAWVRLREIGVPWEILTMPGFISGVVYQRLVPVLCPDCSIPILQAQERIDQETLFRAQQVIDLANDNVRVIGDGCSRCNMTGIIGRTVCAEFVLPDSNLLRMLSRNDFIDAMNYWKASRIGATSGQMGVTALAHAIYKMKKGILSPIDIEEQIGLLTTDIINADNIITAEEVDYTAGVMR